MKTAESSATSFYWASPNCCPHCHRAGPRLADGPCATTWLSILLTTISPLGQQPTKPPLIPPQNASTKKAATFPSFHGAMHCLITPLPHYNCENAHQSHVGGNPSGQTSGSGVCLPTYQEKNFALLLIKWTKRGNKYYLVGWVPHSSFS